MNESSPTVLGSRVWFVTGCSSGFGLALAQEILASGERLIATARNVDALAGLVAEYPDSLEVFTLDVREMQQIEAVVAQAAQVWGRLDVVVNNAGVGFMGALEECSDAEVRANFETNFFGPLHVIQAALPFLREQRSGHIVNISAAAAISNYAGFGVYGAAKAALELAMESLRAEVVSFGIKVTLVQPGPFRTGFIGAMQRASRKMPEYDGTSGKFATLLGRMDGKQPGDPQKAARVIVQMVLDGKAPLRLPLGKYVVKKIRDKAAAMVREVDEWEPAASGTDFGAGN